MPKADVIETPFASIERRFELASYYWLDGKWCPAVKRNDDGTHQIRVLTNSVTNSRTTTDRYGYFELDSDGIVTASPRGYARDYNKTRVTGLSEAVERFATPDPSAPVLRY